MAWVSRSTIVVLPNAFWGLTEAPQLPPQNYRWGRNYYTLATHQCSVENFKLYPWWVTGFVDGEGSFHVLVRKNKYSNHGWRVEQRFTLVLHKKDEALLQKIKSSLGVGKICLQGSQGIQLQVHSLK